MFDGQERKIIGLSYSTVYYFIYGDDQSILYSNLFRIIYIRTQRFKGDKMISKLSPTEIRRILMTFSRKGNIPAQSCQS